MSINLSSAEDYIAQAEREEKIQYGVSAGAAVLVLLCYFVMSGIHDSVKKIPVAGVSTKTEQPADANQFDKMALLLRKAPANADTKPAKTSLSKEKPLLDQLFGITPQAAPKAAEALGFTQPVAAEKLPEKAADEKPAEIAKSNLKASLSGIPPPPSLPKAPTTPEIIRQKISLDMLSEKGVIINGRFVKVGEDACAGIDGASACTLKAISDRAVVIDVAGENITVTATH